MKKTFISILGLLSIAVIAYLGYSKYQEQESKEASEMVTQEDQTTESTNPTFTMEQVAQYGHDQAFTNPDPSTYKCWTVIHGKVYDITEFLSQHPGGESIYSACGIDGTEFFETREFGSGTPHFENARNILEQYYIGDLQT